MARKDLPLKKIINLLYSLINKVKKEQKKESKENRLFFIIYYGKTSIVIQ